MRYYDSQDGAEVFERDIMAAHPDTSFGIPFSPPERYQRITEDVRPVPPAYHRVVPGALIDSGSGRLHTWLVEPMSVAEVVQILTQAVQSLLDSTVQAHNYDGILSACTYANSKNPTFSAEGQACIEWRDAVWSTCYQILGDVQSGERNVPSVSELMNELPALNWPG